MSDCAATYAARDDHHERWETFGHVCERVPPHLGSHLCRCGKTWAAWSWMSDPAFPPPRQPKRIQRQRTKGWRMPEGAVYVGRPSRWGNPIVAGWTWTAAACRAYGYPAAPAWRAGMAVALYRWWLDGEPPIPAIGHQVGRESIEMTEGSIGGALWLVGEGVIHLPPRPNIANLRGRDLACWCPLDDPLRPCHADVLLELANR